MYIVYIVVGSKQNNDGTGCLPPIIESVWSSKEEAQKACYDLCPKYGVRASTFDYDPMCFTEYGQIGGCGYQTVLRIQPCEIQGSLEFDPKREAVLAQKLRTIQHVLQEVPYNDF